MSDLEFGLVPADQLLGDWDELADRVATSPCAFPGWYAAWQEAFGQRQSMVWVARRQGRLAGLLPLQSGRGVLSSPTNWHTPEYVVLADSPEVERALLSTAVSSNRQRLQLAFVERPIVDQLQVACREHGQRLISRVLEEGPIIELSGSFADYEKTLGSHLRAELRRRRRRLEEIGPVEISISRTADPSVLESFFAVEASGWKSHNGTAISDEPKTRQFYVDVARWAADKGWLRLALLTVDGTPVAGDFALQNESTHYLLKTGFDPEYSKFGVGKLLRHDMIRRSFEDGLSLYEFLGIQDEWKKEWTLAVRQRFMAQVFAPTVRGRVDHAAHAYARPVAKSVLARVERWRRR